VGTAKEREHRAQRKSVGKVRADLQVQRPSTSDCRRSSGAESGTPEAVRERRQAKRGLQEASRAGPIERGAGAGRVEKQPLSLSRGDEERLDLAPDTPCQEGDAAAGTSRALWKAASARAVPSGRGPRDLQGGPRRPGAPGPTGTHPTATRRQRRAGCTISASQAAANRPSGDTGPGGTGAGPSRSELQSERSAEPGSSGSSRKRQPTASAKKPAHAEPRHSAMGTAAPH
jgi:hypothetical protein